MIAIIDYGAGNLFSVKNALEYLGLPCRITSRAEEIRRADSYILPGVGAFPFAMKQLAATGLIGELKSQTREKPLLGICLGMQMLFDEGFEFEPCAGLGLIPGEVRRMERTELKIPHMGWNGLVLHQPSDPLLAGVSVGDCVYFVHSYMAHTAPEYLLASCDYGGAVTALVRRGNVYGAQFHPEKSGEVGLQILKNFGGLTR